MEKLPVVKLAMQKSKNLNEALRLCYIEGALDQRLYQELMEVKKLGNSQAH
jgi:hypothetical protein